MGFFSRNKKNKNKSLGGGGGNGSGSGSSDNNSGAAHHYDPRSNNSHSHSHAYSNNSNDYYYSQTPRSNHDPRDYQLSGQGFRPMATGYSPSLIARLPEGVLHRIFGLVCPHATDDSYETFEGSSIVVGEERCMLCDMRDLAHCVAVNRRWRGEGVKVLYHSIRLDPVHYCPLEPVLSDRRKRRSFFDRNGSPEDPCSTRLKLLCRTLREDPVRRGALVQFLKMPYMLREAAQADLARTIAVTPQLRYVDLPEGLFTDEPNFVTLRLEVQARCLELRKMSYMRGSENSLQALATGRVWTKLEVLELNRIGMDGGMLRLVLGGLGQLKALKMSEMEVGDEVFSSGWEEQLPPFPATIEELILTDCKNITSDGLRSWLSTSPESRERLRVLTLNNTGVRVWGLHSIISLARGLKHLAIVEKATVAMPSTPDLQPLRSTSLETLRYEITSATPAKKYGSPPHNPSSITASYYTYLATSLLSGGLPNLRSAYVRDVSFPDLLLGLPPLPLPPFSSSPSARPGSSGSLTPFSSSPSKPANFGGLPPLQPGSLPNNNNHNNNPFAPSHGHHRPQGSLSSLAPFSQNQHPNRFSSNNPFASLTSSHNGFLNLPAKLEVFTKSDEDDQLNWNFVRIGGGGGGGGGRQNGSKPGERPLSSYGLGADILGDAGGWSSGAGARRSVLVGGRGEGGGFLAVPDGNGKNRGGRREDEGQQQEEEWPRPRTREGEGRRRERLDLWR
ncbi:hypothetical protein QBC41DRAFT_47330 [Cercophora samala]|uniref:F-box domain-containing protein n=1 Tax=Cercophora samala TaxID=330535 RepID=A0AA40D402_9PEZI|nr:hypothetical protein QBC41DRAFT_47330 [Cercophora samala]